MTRDPREIASAIQGRAMDVTGTGEVVYDEYGGMTSAGVGRIAADAERELRVALGKAQP